MARTRRDRQQKIEPSGIREIRFLIHSINTAKTHFDFASFESIRTKYVYIHRQTDRQTDGWADGRVGRRTGGRAGGRAGGWADGRADSGGWAGRQAGREI
ncbi:hypothetical protein DPMN_056600 [Dreissena polymorpha]|uniref:Uncharacterized protein n=1 Tax=Dreissena polymorpha TaxID=45954 RepID=A0A9D4CUU5_DREPO|nr:hypothetical protein DPMN_056600 [Dreissena polymorpha]